MSSLRFRSLIEINNINPYVLVSAKRAERLQKSWRKPLPVRVRVNGKPEKPWRINLMPVGDGSFYLYLHGDVRKPSGPKVGETVTLDFEFVDDSPAKAGTPNLRSSSTESNRRIFRRKGNGDNDEHHRGAESSCFQLLSGIKLEYFDGDCKLFP